MPRFVFGSSGSLFITPLVNVTLPATAWRTAGFVDRKCFTVLTMAHRRGNGTVFKNSDRPYDGRDGRPAAHLVIAWPHGVPVVDGMVDAFNADGNMSVASIVNAKMRNASELGACIYATEKSMLQEQEKANEEVNHRGNWMRAYNQRHIQHKTVPHAFAMPTHVFLPFPLQLPWSGGSVTVACRARLG